MPSKEENTNLSVSTSETKEKEPLPENTQEDIAEVKYETYEDFSKKIKSRLLECFNTIKEITHLMKDADKSHAKTAKEVKKKQKRNKSDVNRKPSGFESPVLIPSKFYDFIKYGLEHNKFSEEKTKDLVEQDLNLESKISRSLVTKIAYDYIKNSNLYIEETKDGENQGRRLIAPDEEIKKLFSIVEEDDPIGFFNFQKFVSRLFPKKQKSDSDESEVEVEVENDVIKLEEVSDVEEVVERSKQKKNKNKTASSAV